MFRRVLSTPITWNVCLSRPLNRAYSAAPSATAAPPPVSQEGFAPVIRVTLIKSRNGSSPTMLKTLDSLGLRKMHRSKLHKNLPAIRGMINKSLSLSPMADTAAFVDGASKPQSSDFSGDVRSWATKATEQESTRAYWGNGCSDPGTSAKVIM